MIQNNDVVLPGLKHYNILDNKLPIKVISQIKISNDVGEIIDFVTDLFKITRDKIKIDNNTSLSLTAGEISYFPAPPQYKQGYSIAIEKKGLAISAFDIDGMFYAIKTLEQLLDGTDVLQCAQISDWPDLALRGWHLDCKGNFPNNIEELYKLIDQLAAWKFNTLLIEYEDRFPYQFAPELINSEGAPSLTDWTDFLNYCRKRRFTIIPLVQTLGHTEFLLKHPRFYSLRENGQFNELCPSNPEALDTIKIMLDEVCKLHEKDSFFHIGCDETWALGTCAACQKHEKNKLELLLEHVKTLHGFLKKHGKKTLIWTDMFWRCGTPEMVKVLPEDVVLCDWNYDGKIIGSDYFYSNGRRMVAKNRIKSEPLAIQDSYEEFDSEPELRDFAQKYFITDPLDGIGVISPYVKLFKDLGYKVIGTAAERCYRPEGSSFGQDMLARFNNIASWTKLTETVNFDGIILSSWSRSSHFSPVYTPRILTADARAMAAQYFWNNYADQKNIFKQIAHKVYGCEQPEAELEEFYKGLSLLEAGKTPGIKRYLLEKLKLLEQKSTCNDKQIKLFKLWVDFEIFRTSTCDCADKMEYFVHSSQSGIDENDIYNVKQIAVDIKNIQNELEQWEKRLSDELEGVFSPKDLQDFVKSRIVNLIFRFKSLESFYIRRILLP